MRNLCLIGSVLSMPHLLGAETLTLEQALTQVLTQHPLVDIQQYEIEKARSLQQTASQWPNPTLGYKREDLRDRGLESGEWIAGMGISLGHLWSRGARMEAAQAEIQVASVEAIQTRQKLRYAVQKAYVQTYFAQQRHRIWQTVSAQFAEATRIGQARFAEGDIGHYEQQRLALEARQYQQREALAHVRWTQHQQRLALLLDPESVHTAHDLVLVQFDPSRVADLSLLEQQALQHRGDVLRAQAEYRARTAEQKMARRQRWPESELFVGYKEQRDDFQGVAAELSIELPFFDRHQGETRRTEAGARQQHRRVEWLEQQAVQEVRQAHARYRFYQTQIEGMGDAQPSEHMLDIARYAYGEGEMNLVEWMDAVRAYGESFDLRFELMENYQLSLFELEQATGTPLVFPE